MRTSHLRLYLKSELKSASAKFLWKRIPDKIKESNQELTTIWLVGKSMWRREYSNIYDVIKSFPVWPNHLKNIMNLILETTRQTASNLISKAYSTIHISDASKLLGITDEETLDWVRQYNYELDQNTGFILINKDSDLSGASPGSIGVGHKGGSSSPIIENRSDLLEKLTDYIVFLESN